jgi:hypothetical protein
MLGAVGGAVCGALMQTGRPKDGGVEFASETCIYATNGTYSSSDRIDLPYDWYAILWRG